MRKQNIVVAGWGAVGQCVDEALRPVANIFIDDPYHAIARWRSTQPSDLADLDAVIICVATPANVHNNSCDTSFVEEVIEKYGTKPRYLLKSTITPDFFAKPYMLDGVECKITYSPEYIRGTTGNDYVTDFKNATFAIYGGGEMRWWDELFRLVQPNMKDVRYMTAAQASFTKYFLNCYLAAKTTFFNHMKDIVDHMPSMGDPDYDIIIDGLCLDPRVSKSHTQVPGPDGKKGFGGHCFPKDVSAMSWMSTDLGVENNFLDTVLNFNDTYRE